MDDEFKKQLLGVTTEVGSGIATDVATTPLLAGGPLGIAAYVVTNFGQGAYTNYLVQKHLYGNENINWGEVFGSGAAGAIPFMNIGASSKVAKYVGKAGTVKRGIVGGLGTALVGEQTRVGIDEKRLLNFKETLLAGTVGGTLGGGFTAVGKRLSRRSNDFIDDYTPPKLSDTGLRQALSFSVNNNPGNIQRRQILKNLGYLSQPRKPTEIFSAEDLADLQEQAYQHRLGRDVDKKDLMKGFSGFLSYVRSDGFEDIAIVVKKKRNINKGNPAAKENYEVKTLSKIMQDMRVNTKWATNQADSEVISMQDIRKKLNQLGDKYGDDPVLAKLMEYGDEAYLEHVIAKAQYDWLWNLKEADPTNYPWITALERNSPDNLRLLVKKPYKKLKDTTEGRIKKLYNDKLVRNNKFKDAYIIDIEDPETTAFSSSEIIHRNNPGNLRILKASKSDKKPKVVGMLGDYLADFYSDDFKNNYNGKKLLAFFQGLDKQQQKKFGRYAPKTRRVKGEKGYYEQVETYEEYRERILNNLIDFIISQEGKSYSIARMQKEVLKDMDDFYALFATELGVLTEPQYIKDLMFKAARKQAGLTNKGRRTDAELNFYKNQRNAMMSHLSEIQAYERGERRFSKQYYRKLINQLNRMSGMTFDYESGFDNSQDILEEILK
jgi:hypothetical protein